MKQNKPPPKKRSRGRPKLAKSKTRLMCQCGGVSGKGDNGKKKSAALMVEAIKLEIGSRGLHPRQKHYVPDISEITPVISLLSSTRKK